MTLISPVEGARLLRDAGFRGEPLVIMTAVCYPESGVQDANGVWWFDTAAENTGDSAPPKWGPSIGFPQIRSLQPRRPELVTYPWRDPAALRGDPEFQAYAAWQVYHTEAKDSFRPWSGYTSGAYRNFLTAAQQAVSQIGDSGLTPNPQDLPPGAIVGAVTPPPTASLQPSTTELLPADLRVDGERLTTLAKPTHVELVRTIREPSFLRVEVDDTRRQLLRSGLLEYRSRVTVDGIVFELADITKSDHRLTLTFIDAAASEYMHDRGGKIEVQPPGTGTRGEFLERLARRVSWVQFDIEGGDTALVELSRDTAEKPSESTWDAMGRIAEQVQWRRLVVANRLLIGSDEWLMSRTSPLRLTEDTPGIDTIDFESRLGAEVERATITASTTLWALPPTMAIELDEMGPGNGDWMVEEVRRRGDTRMATVVLTRPREELSEAEIERDTYDTNPEENPRPTGTLVQVGPVSAAGWSWPNAGQVISPFGACRSGLSCSGPCCRRHEGIDIGAPLGTPIYAAADGEVVAARAANPTNGYGLFVYINHDGDLFGWQTRYAHCHTVEVTRGQRVKQGQRIATVGQTGNARTTPPHNHFEMRQNGAPVNPEAHLPRR